MREILAITKALADKNRLRVLMMLGGRELCVCQIFEVLGLAPSTVSKHLAVLRAAQLVESRKEGRWVYYRLPRPDEASPSACEALRWLARWLADDEEIRADRRALAGVVAITPEELCQIQSARSKSCSSARGTPAAARWPKAGRGI